jgi:hypothetical protein
MTTPKPAQIPTVPAPRKLTTPAFPSAYPDFFTQDHKLDKALLDAIDKGPGRAWVTAVAIVALKSDGTRPMAAFRPDEMHFSASFVKIAAMYGAFELLRTMNQLSQEYGKAPKTAFLNAAAAHFRPLIREAVKKIPPLKGLSEAHMFPGFSINYDATPDPNGVLGLTFNSEYDNSLLQMISLSDDTESARCVHRLGYGYLNGALTSAGFFDGKKSGIWLAGDYAPREVSESVVEHWPYFRIDSVNDKGVAQALTVSKAVKLITLIADRKLAGPEGSDGMLKLMKAAADVPEVYITRTPGLSFKVTHNKLGYADRKVGDWVYSEGSIIEHDHGDKFVVVWQNFYPDDPDNAKAFRVVSWVVDNALLLYLFHK